MKDFSLTFPKSEDFFPSFIISENLLKLEGCLPFPTFPSLEDFFQKLTSQSQKTFLSLRDFFPSFPYSKIFLRKNSFCSKIFPDLKYASPIRGFFFRRISNA